MSFFLRLGHFNETVIGLGVEIQPNDKPLVLASDSNCLKGEFFVSNDTGPDLQPRQITITQKDSPDKSFTYRASEVYVENGFSLP